MGVLCLLYNLLHRTTNKSGHEVVEHTLNTPKIGFTNKIIKIYHSANTNPQEHRCANGSTRAIVESGPDQPLVASETMVKMRPS
jgi:hypothetical protein